MDDLISRQAAIDALTKHEIELPIYAPRETDVFWNDAIDCCVSEIEALPSAQQDVTDTNVGDMINRQAAISRAVTITMFGRDIRVVGVSELESLPSAQPDLDEWCTDCKEYDSEKHHCPRYNRVIREALNGAEPRKPGRWNFIGENMFECTSCGVVYTTEQLNGLRNYDTDPYAPKFCPNCGADMRENMKDLIDREKALDCFHDWADKYGDVHTADEMTEYQAIEALPTEKSPCALCQYNDLERDEEPCESCTMGGENNHFKAVERWIPFKTRELTDEEKEEHPEWDYILECKLPEDGQRILVSINLKGHEEVQYDEFYSDDGSYLDSGYEIGSEAVAWMPLPKPYREE